jgi:hypothetical protein
MAEDDDIESFWEGLRPPKVPEPATVDLNEALKHCTSTESFSLDYAQFEQQIWNGLGLQRPQSAEESALAHELQHTWISSSTERLNEVRQRSLERFAESLGMRVRSPSSPVSTDVTRNFEAIRTAFSALGVTCRTAQLTDSYGRRTLELTLEPTQSQDPTLLSYEVNSHGNLVINIDLNGPPVRL